MSVVVTSISFHCAQKRCGVSIDIPSNGVSDRDFGQAEKEVVQQGWYHKPGSENFYCPACWKQMRKDAY